MIHINDILGRSFELNNKNNKTKASNENDLIKIKKQPKKH